MFPPLDSVMVRNIEILDLRPPKRILSHPKCLTEQIESLQHLEETGVLTNILDIGSDPVGVDLVLLNLAEPLSILRAHTK